MPDNISNQGYGDNYGGVSRLWILPVSLAVSLEAAMGVADVPDNSTLASLFTEVELIPESCNQMSRKIDTDQGPMFENEVRGFVVKEREEVTSALDDMGEYVIVVTQDNNGLRKMAGGRNEPLLLQYDLMKGQQVRDMNRTDFYINGNTRAR